MIFFVQSGNVHFRDIFRWKWGCKLWWYFSYKVGMRYFSSEQSLNLRLLFFPSKRKFSGHVIIYWLLPSHIWISETNIYNKYKKYICVCVCVWEREREINNVCIGLIKWKGHMGLLVLTWSTCRKIKSYFAF